MPAEISYDLVMERDMDFVEGTLRIPPADWQVFIFSKRDVPDPIVTPQKWHSGVTGVFVTFPRAQVLSQSAVETILGTHFRVSQWAVVRGPDSMQLR
jgi:hypothetical protein